MNHTIESSGQYCSCGQDAVSCQICGHRVCGNGTFWLDPVPGKTFSGNGCRACLRNLADPKCPLCTGKGYTTAHGSICSCIRNGGAK